MIALEASGAYLKQNNIYKFILSTRQLRAHYVKNNVLNSEHH